MNALTITYIIGTDDAGIGEDEIESVEGYRAEVEERLAELFPEATYVDVVIENGSSKVRVEGLDGLDWETQGDQQESMIEAVNAIADEVWNHGNWHNAPGRA